MSTRQWRHPPMLTQVLAVVAMIAVFLGLMLPLIVRPKRKPQRALSCLSNMKQSILFAIMFSYDHDGAVATYAVSDGAAPLGYGMDLPDGAAPAGGEQFTWMRVSMAGGYNTDPQITLCAAGPVGRFSASIPPSGYSPEIARSSKVAWQRMGDPAAASDLSGDDGRLPQWLTFGILRPVADGRDAGKDNVSPGVETLTLGGEDKNAADRPFFVDSYLARPGVEHDGFARFSPLALDADVGVVYEKHNGKINIAFADGHAAPTTGKDYLAACRRAFGEPAEGGRYVYRNEKGIVPSSTNENVIPAVKRRPRRKRVVKPGSSVASLGCGCDAPEHSQGGDAGFRLNFTFSPGSAW